MSDPARALWTVQRLADAVPLPIVLIRTPMADRYYGTVYPGIAGSLSAGFFIADLFYDADQYFSADIPLYDQGARLVAVEGLDRTVRPIETDVLGSWSQAERPSGSVELENGDKLMSEMVGREYLLNQVVRVAVTFPTLDIGDALVKLDGKIISWTLTRASLRLEVEAL